ncbi:1-acyl-sn-glycerol-3-phosphate acyltransferase [Spongiactinospora gelatinilytica]|uniref:1-acyl-sn-glycerol-3-phosphate acyltransferase n=1 Tax=Spongiactinospora gelatinilytica TaxID=2666298 RepID=A0A2W2FJ79_9ACTN|nr:lysophospholipid acyltransferase family protein [Spongiactinospora gelatinilytica]PZG25410.1 1-acyl-sn-glycerol-3-phosphate acyltransferase [Spongiactinospora gelatinilytica]
MSEIVYPPVILTAMTLFRALDLKLHIEGADHVPRQGGAVLVSNHISYLDFIFAGMGARRSRRLVRFLAKKEVFDHRISGPLMRGMHHIPVDRAAGAGSYAASLRALKAGEVVGVFAEGTISRSFTVKEIKNGAIRMAAATGVPMIPVGLWGTQRLWTKGRPRNLLQRHVPITILVGEPIHPKRGDDMAARTGELSARLTELLDRAQRTYPEIPAGVWWQPRHLGGSAPTPEEAAAMDEAEAAKSGD